jgi:hypothetical protein
VRSSSTPFRDGKLGAGTEGTTQGCGVGEQRAKDTIDRRVLGCLDIQRAPNDIQRAQTLPPT